MPKATSLYVRLTLYQGSSAEKKEFEVHVLLGKIFGVVKVLVIVYMNDLAIIIDLQNFLV